MTPWGEAFGVSWEAGEPQILGGHGVWQDRGRNVETEGEASGAPGEAEEGVRDLMDEEMKG